MRLLFVSSRSIPFRMEKAKTCPSVMRRLTFAARSAWRCVALAGVLLGLAACSAEPPEQALRKQLAQLQQAVEAGQVDDAMDLISEDFGGPQGMDRAALHNLLRLQVLGNRRVGVTTTPAEIQLQQDSATVRFNALLTGSGQGRWLPDQAQSYAVTLGWRLHDGQWQLYHADWQANR